MTNEMIKLGGGKFATRVEESTGHGKILVTSEGDKSERFLAHEMGFLRGTDIGASYVNKEGLVVRGRENMFTYSNLFTGQHSGGAWNHSGLSNVIGPNQGQPQEGYNGGEATFIRAGNNAAETPITHKVSRQNVVVSSLHTISIYAKANGYNWLCISTSNSNGSAWFDLENGVVGTVYEAVAGTTMEDVGNGWYRCSISLQSTSTTVGFNICRQDGETDFVADPTLGLLIQDAQLERGLSLTPYMHSVSHTENASLKSNEPRIDYSSGKPVLLYEAPSQNLVQYSEGILGASAQAPSGATPEQFPNITLQQGEINPMGIKGGVGKIDNILSVSASDRLGFAARPPGNVTGGETYSGSIWVKGPKGKITHYHMKRFGAGPHTTSGGIYHTFSGEWERIFTGPLTLHAENTDCGIMFANTGLANTDEFLFWGAQIEHLRYSTSFIPSYGVNTSRSTEGEFSSNSSIAGRSYDFTGSFTLFVDFARFIKDGRLGSATGIYFRNAGITDGNSDGTVQERVFSLFANSQTDDNEFRAGALNIYLEKDQPGVPNNGYIFNSGINPTFYSESPKIAIVYDKPAQRLAYYINGSLWEETTNYDLDFGDSNNTYAFIRSQADATFDINQLSFFNVALNDFECRELTGETSFESYEEMAETSNYELYE